MGLDCTLEVFSWTWPYLEVLGGTWPYKGLGWDLAVLRRTLVGLNWDSAALGRTFARSGVLDRT